MSNVKKHLKYKYYSLNCTSIIVLAIYYRLIVLGGASIPK